MQAVGQFGEIGEEKELPGVGALLALKGEASGHESQEHSPLKAPLGEAHSGGGRCGNGPPSRGSRARQVKVKGREQSRDSWIEFPSVELVPVSEGGREPAKSTGLTWPELHFLAVNLVVWERLTGEGRLELDKARGQLGHGWKQVTEAQTEPAAIRTERR